MDMSSKIVASDEPHELTHAVAKTGKPHAHGPQGGALVTVITATEPKCLTKRYSLDGEGSLHREGGGILFRGHASIREVKDLKDFGQLLMSLKAAQALTYGVPPVEEIDLVTKADWERHGRPETAIPRTNDTFRWADGPGIMMLDYDPASDAEVLSREDLLTAVRAAVPAFQEAEMLWIPSASSHIQNSKTGEDLTGLRGQRLYLMVKDACDIPRAGSAIADNLWLAGHGYFKISGAGAMLQRTLVDTAVWQASRLDFAAGAECEGPLVQGRGEPTLITGSLTMIDTKAAIPSLDGPKAKRLAALVTAAKAEVSEAAAKARSAWLDAKAREMGGPDADDAKIACARDAAERALETRHLPRDFVIHVIDGGTEKPVFVRDILADRKKYHRMKTLDPLEPEYHGRRQVGMLFLSRVPLLHSFARGEETYILGGDRHEVVLRQGGLSDTVQHTLEILREDPHLFDLGDQMVLVEHGRLHPMAEHSLNQYLGTVVQFREWKKTGLVDVDPPAGMAKRILALGPRRHLKPLMAVITAPTLRPDGTVVFEPGYDPETQVYLDIDVDGQIEPLPANPDGDAVRAALEVLWAPFRDFPFDDPVSRGVHLAALLTATVRPMLPTSPGFGYDAPIQGSGKTLLATCVAAMAGNLQPSVFTHVPGSNDDEIRKRLTSFFRTGVNAMICDNILGAFDSAALAAALTSANFSDRILGASEIVTTPNRALFLFTGNNLTLAGDMTRRILVARIDPRSETPFARQFETDPRTHVNNHRQEMVRAALTLMIGWRAAGAESAPGRMASFEDWNDLVRNTVAWIGSSVAPGEFADPMDAVTHAMSQDPEHEALGEVLRALKDAFGGKEVTTKEIMNEIRPYANHHMAIFSDADRPGPRLCEALACLNPSAATTVTSLGRTLSYRKDRIVEGLVLRQGKDSHSKTSLWRVEETA